MLSIGSLGLIAEGVIANVRDSLLIDVNLLAVVDVDLINFYAALDMTWDLRTPADESFAADSSTFGAQTGFTHWLLAGTGSELVLWGKWPSFPRLDVAAYFGDLPHGA
jgi:hypothetical protein